MIESRDEPSIAAAEDNNKGIMDYTTLPHLLPADQIVKNAARRTVDPEWRYRQLIGFPSYMAVTAAAYEQELKRAIRQVGIGAGMHVLDAACGPGMGSRYLIEVGASQVIGYDINPAMLTLAKQLHPLDDFAGRLTFQQGDLNHPLPFDDNTFDAVWMGDIWIPQALAEVRRVTRPGGMIILKMTGIAPGISYLWDLDFQARVEAALCHGSQPLATHSTNGERAKQSFFGQFRQSGQWQQLHLKTTIIERVAPVPPSSSLQLCNGLDCGPELLSRITSLLMIGNISVLSMTVILPITSFDVQTDILCKHLRFALVWYRKILRMDTHRNAYRRLTRACIVKIC